MEEFRGENCKKTAKTIAEERRAGVTNQIEEDTERIISYLLDTFDSKEPLDLENIIIAYDDGGLYGEEHVKIEELDDIEIPDEEYISIIFSKVLDFFEKEENYTTSSMHDKGENFIIVNIEYY